MCGLDVGAALNAAETQRTREPKALQRRTSVTVALLQRHQGLGLQGFNVVGVLLQRPIQELESGLVVVVGQQTLRLCAQTGGKGEARRD